MDGMIVDIIVMGAPAAGNAPDRFPDISPLIVMRQGGVAEGC
jgi:hypothetical protein